MRQFPQQFLRPLILHYGSLQHHLYNLIPARVLARIENAALAQPELLLVLRARRNLEQRLAVDGGYFDLGSQSRFRYRDRYFEQNVVALALEQRMIFHVRCDVEIARRRSHGPRIAFARHAEARTILRARRNAYLNRFGMRQPSVAMAGGTGILQPPFAIAARTREIELHVARHLSHVARAIALWTGDRSRVMAARCPGRSGIDRSG